MRIVVTIYYTGEKGQAQAFRRNEKKRYSR
ncbi:hypothetical protein SAMN05216514_10124 [Kandleria vitulina]|nr:hypothetical protein SAMN05216514_10124 [Kandleria vitulina]